MTNATCTIDGCEKPLRSSGATMCGMHYHRVYRHGSPDKTARAEQGVSLGRRYTMIHAAGHPLADKYQRVYTHRKVLYDHIGPGPHPCHWCSAPLDWTPKGEPDSLQVDHLNNDGADNRIENLVPACPSCNTARGQQRRSDALRERGYWSEHDTIAGLKRSGRRPRIDPEVA